MTQMERRISHQLVQYWQGIKGGRLLPAETSISAEELGEMWEDCFLIYLGGSDGESEAFYSYSHVGKNLMPLFVEENYGKPDYLRTIPTDRLRMALAEMRMTLLPIVEDADEFELGERYIRYRQCLLPIGTEKGEIRAVFGGMRYVYV